MVTEPTLGQIRLQWWRESVEEIYRGVPRRHEVVGPLAQAVTRHDLTRAHFDRVIDAREADLQDETPASVGELEGYCESTAAPLLYLCLEILGVRDGPAYAAVRQRAVQGKRVSEVEDLGGRRFIINHQIASLTRPCKINQQ